MYVTLNISTTDVRLLSVKGKQVKKWGSISLASGLVRDGLILQPEVVGASIDSLFKSTKVSKRRVITSLSGLPFTYRILSLPRMRSALLDEAIQRAAGKEMPLPLEELYLSWKAIGSKGDEQDFFVLGVSRSPIDALVQALAEAGVKPHLIDLRPLALARAANRRDALIVALEPDCFDIVLVANGIPTIMHAVTPRGEEASIEDNIRRLSDELSKTVKFYNSSHPHDLLSPTTPLLLAGELSVDTAAVKLIQTEVEYPVELLIPPLKFPSDLPVALYAANMGLIRKKAPQKTESQVDADSFHDIKLNILPDKYGARAHPGLKRLTLVSLALILAIGPLFPLYQIKNKAEFEVVRLQSELYIADQELHHARLALNEAKQAEDTISEISADADALEQGYQDILSKGGDFTSTLKLVTTGTLPTEARFTSMRIDADQITVRGEADNWLAVISYVTALELEGSFPEVRIKAINESSSAEAEEPGVSFEIIISRWA